MNKAKRGLELASGIISIVIGSIMCLIFLVFIASVELVIEMIPEYEMIQDYLVIVSVFILLLNVAIIILGALMCPAGYQKGTIKSKLGRGIALSVLLGINFLLTIEVPLLMLANGATLILLIVSLCLKHDSPNFVYPKLNNVAVNNVVTTTSVNVSEELVKDNVQEYVENNEQVELSPEPEKGPATAIYVENSSSIEDVETQLIKLKQLKDQGIIEEDQYKEAVRKLLSKL